MSLKAVFVTIFLFFEVLVPFGDAVRCYQCPIGTDYSDDYLKGCSNPANVECGVHSVCAKFEYTLYEFTTSGRVSHKFGHPACSVDFDLVESDLVNGCRHRNLTLPYSKFTMDGDMCICSTDLCNGF